MSDTLAPKSYNIAFTSFESSFRALLKRAAFELTARAPRRDSPPEPTPGWAVYAKTVLNIVNKNKAVIDTFEQRVRELFDSHTSELVSPVFGEDGSVNDQFLKSRTSFVPHGSSVSGLEGPVVFFSDNATTHTACLAIGEIYRACIAEHLAAAEGNTARRLLPTLTLLDWYAMLYHSVPEDSEHKEALAQNVIDLCHAAEEQAPGTGPNAAPGGAVESVADAQEPPSQLDGLMNIMSGFVSTFGGAHAGNINDTFGKFKNVLSTLYNEVRTIETASPSGGPPSVPEIIGRLGDVLQSPSIQKEIEGFSSDASALLGTLGLVPGAPADAAAPQLSDPSKQIE